MSELSASDKLEFDGFDAINNYLEQNPLLGYQELYAAYVNIVLGEASGLSEMDYHVKFLLDEKKMALTKILQFGKIKFLSQDLLQEVIEESFPTESDIMHDKITQKILTKKIGNLIITFQFSAKEPQEFQVGFDIEKYGVYDFIANLKKIDFQSMFEHPLFMGVDIKLR